MELTDIAQEIRRVSQRLDKAPKAIFEASREYAEAERDYRMELSKEITRLRAEGMNVTLVPDIARGNVSELKFKRDLAEGQYKASIESAKVLQSEMSGLQSIFRVQSEV